MFNITEEIRYIGVNDHQLDLFEGQYTVPDGMAYNSYVILDEKIAVMDSVDAAFGEAWLSNLRAAIGDRRPDYLIIQHMEPDHSANILTFVQAFPEAVLVGNAKTFAMLGQFFEELCLPEERKCIVKDGDTLSLGRHALQFLFAPMVHWPEVMFTFDSTDHVLFSADAFGKFGALDVEADWACEARRYYFGIVGKYGAQVQNILKRAAALDIQIICPLHGPVLSENLGYYLDLYHTWSSYGVESEGICIAYTSAHGHTKAAAELLKTALIERGCQKVAITDLAREDMAEAVEDAFRYGKLVLASPTYNGGIFPFMKQFIDHLTERGYQNRTIGLIENGSWAPMAAKLMRGMFEKSKNITFTETTVTLKSALNQQSREQIAALADELMT